ncbi:MAG: PH domain-containing protein [Pseudomonadota bacterium]|nr:PH domain-containing protein [Pseudomonadota bacterium]MDE3037123.1 PH domain-containing protein [Pseudomonadota bacterium]
MPTLTEVNRQIAAYPHRYIFWTQKEIRSLPEVLDHGEPIKALTSGYVNGCTWLAVCTDRRLIFINRGMFYGIEQVQMPLDRIQSIDHQFTLFFGSISVFDGVNVFTLGMVRKSSILPFVRMTEEAMYAQRHPAGNAPAAARPEDVAGQLTKLAELKEKGYLTDAEFQAQKKKLLDN